MGEWILTMLQRLYWIILALILLIFGLLNRDLLATKREVDLLFGKFNLQAAWFIGAFVVAFLIQILLARALFVTVKRRAHKIDQELAQTKASIYDREKKLKLKEAIAKPEPPPPAQPAGDEPE